MSPVTICPWFGSVNGGVVQLQGKSFILSKMFLIWLIILDRIVLVNVYTVKNCSVFFLNCVGKFFFTFFNVYHVHAFVYEM